MEERTEKAIDYLVNATLTWEQMEALLDLREEQKAINTLEKNGNYIILSMQRLFNSLNYLKDLPKPELNTVITFLEKITDESYKWLKKEIQETKK